MLRSTKTITLTLLAAVAVSACDEQSEIKHCVDENGVVQDESNCTNSDIDSGTVVQSGNPHIFHWYYGGYRSPQSPGTRLTGGSYNPSPGKVYSPPSISRGGFGSTGEGFGGVGE